MRAMRASTSITSAYRMRRAGKAGMMCVFILLFLLGLILKASAATALPPIAAEFYGTVELDGRAAEPGTNVTVHDSSGKVCGNQTTRRTGEFGLLSCKGDDPATPEDEGAVNGEAVTLTVNNISAYNATWREGSLSMARLEARTPTMTGSTVVRFESFGLPAAVVIPGIALLLAAATYVYIRKGTEK